MMAHSVLWFLQLKFAQPSNLRLPYSLDLALSEVRVTRSASFGLLHTKIRHLSVQSETVLVCVLPCCAGTAADRSD